MGKLGKIGLALGAAAVPLFAAAAARAADPQGFAAFFGQPAAPQAVMVFVPQAPAMAVDDPAFQAIRQLDEIMDRGLPAAMAQMIVQQDAMMRQLVAQMNATMNAPVPSLGQAGAPGSQMVMTSFSSGAGTCSQVVTMSFDGHDQPKTTVRRAGTACGALPQMHTVPAEAPAEPELHAVPPRSQPPLIQVDREQVAPRKPVYRG